MPKYSLVVPVFNEEESLPKLFEEIRKTMDPLEEGYEIVFVDDCSCDQSSVIMDHMRRDFFDVVRIITLSSRSGQTYAMRQGMDAARGDIVATLDADLQNDPGDIPRMLEKMKEGYDVVCGWRKARQDKPLKAILSKTGNVVQRLLTGLKIHDVSCTLRIYKKECLPDIGLEWPGLHRFIPLGLSLKGYHVGEIESNHRLRQYGSSKYSHKRIFKVVVDFFRVLCSSRKRKPQAH